jgi:hypothetical protein
VAGGGPEAGAGDALGDAVAGEGGASIESRVPSSGALKTEAATVAAIRPTRGVFAIIDHPGSWLYTRTSDLFNSGRELGSLQPLSF